MSVAPRGVIGVVHLPALPGDPRADATTTFERAREVALEDARALAAGGVSAIVVENFGSAPFVKGTSGARIPPHQATTLALVAAACKEATKLRVGVNCLRNDAYSAIGIAAAAGLDFVRINVHVGAYVTDQGLIEAEAADTLRYRAALGASNVAIVADVLVKHAAPLAPLEPEQATRDTFERGLADAVVVSGEGTGHAVSVERLVRVRTAAEGRTVLVGSGLTPENAAAIAPHCDGAFVGTYVKRDGRISAPVDETRVRRLVEATQYYWKRG